MIYEQSLVFEVEVLLDICEYVFTIWIFIYTCHDVFMEEVVDFFPKVRVFMGLVHFAWSCICTNAVNIDS
jgi:hypothetical protein